MSKDRDKELFQDLMQGVKPLKKNPDKDIIEKKRKPLSGISIPSIRFESEGEQDKFDGYDRPPAQKKRKRKITRQFHPDAQIDLHGETLDQAMFHTKMMLDHGKSGKFQSLLVITGKGMNSGEAGGVLKREIWDYLIHLHDERIREVRWAPRHLGGEGAILILFV